MCSPEQTVAALRSLRRFPTYITTEEDCSALDVLLRLLTASNHESQLSLLLRTLKRPSVVTTLQQEDKYQYLFSVYVVEVLISPVHLLYVQLVAGCCRMSGHLAGDISTNVNGIPRRFPVTTSYQLYLVGHRQWFIMLTVNVIEHELRK